MFGVAAGVAATLLFVAMGAGSKPQALVYSSNDPADIAEIAEILTQAGIAYEIDASGTMIRTARDRVGDARVLVAREGATSGSSMGYEILDNQSALGTTQFVQNINRIRALEGEIARSLTNFDSVAAARVHLAMPERRLFEREETSPSASVVLDVRGDLRRSEAIALRNLVANAVPGLSPNRVTILDNQGRLLYDGAAEGEDAVATALDDRRAQLENRFRTRILQMLENHVGRGAADVQVAVELQTMRVTQSEEIFDPNSQVARSVETRELREGSSDRETDDATTVTENIPETADDTGGDALLRQSDSTSLSEVTNFELSRTTRTQLRAPGDVARISVAVLVDGVLDVGADGAEVYAERSPEDLAVIEDLTRAAIAFDEARGDSVYVANLPFSKPDAPELGEPAASAFSFDKNDIMRVIELGVLALIALLVIVFVARPLLKSIASTGAALAPAGALPGMAGAGALPGPDGVAPPPLLQAPEGASEAVTLMSPDEGDDAALAGMARIDGNVKEAAVEKVSEIISDHPDRSLAIIRGWLHDQEPEI